MKKIITVGLFNLLLLNSLIATDNQNLVIRTESGDSIVMEIVPEESFSDVVERIKTALAVHDAEAGIEQIETAPQEIVVNYMAAPSEFVLYAAKSNASAQRSYWKEVAPQEKEVISYICRTLSKESLRKLLSLKKKLKDTGDKVEHLHPLRFAMCIWSDEELKACAAQIQDRGWVWGEFANGLTTSLEKENNAGNLTQAQIDHFAATVHIDSMVITPILKEKRWKDFVKTLIKLVPRKGSTGRYDA